MSFSPRTEYPSNHLHYRVLRNGWTQSFTERQQPPTFLIPEGPVNGRCLFLGRHTRRFVKMRTTRAPTCIQQTLTGFVLPLHDARRIRGPNDRHIQMQKRRVYHPRAGETTSGHRRQSGLCGSLRPDSLSPSLHALCLPGEKQSFSNPHNKLRRLRPPWTDSTVRLWDSTIRDRTPPGNSRLYLGCWAV